MQRLIAYILALLLFPFWLVISFIQLLVYKRIFFTQLRVGQHERLFKLWKFQSLKTKKANEKDLDRLNWWGKLLRRSSFDETLQLINVAKGDMAFVGPRPLLPEYLPLYSIEQRKRHTVKPGITGWAQVKGRNSLSWAAQFELDVWYVENHSWALNMKIIGLTLLQVFKSPAQESQMREAFNGKN